MRLLLDTHVALWALTDSPRLSADARTLILSPTSEIAVSAASVWEIAIKHGLNKARMPISAKQALDYFLDAGYSVIPVTAAQAASVQDLPRYHNDPFDRLLVAQSILEPMRLLTHDRTLERYGETILLI